jgi:hypothetical protein
VAAVGLWIFLLKGDLACGFEKNLLAGLDVQSRICPGKISRDTDDQGHFFRRI